MMKYLFGALFGLESQSKTLSASGIEMLKACENFEATAYLIPGESNHTIGYGHVIQGGGKSVTINGAVYTTITSELAHILLKQDIANIFDLRSIHF